MAEETGEPGFERSCMARLKTLSFIPCSKVESWGVLINIT